MRQVLWWVALIGVPLSALSLTSLVQRLLDVGLAGAFQELMDFYRTYSRAVLGYLPDLFDFSFPAFIYDCWGVSLFLATIQLRATLMAEASKGAPQPISVPYVMGGLLFMVFLTYSLLGIVFGVFTIVSTLSARLFVPSAMDRVSTPEYPMRRYANWVIGSLAAAAIAVFVFFALNAYAPSSL